MLGEAAVFLARVEDQLLEQGIIDGIHELVEVERGDGAFPGLPGPDWRYHRVVVQIENLRVETIASVAEGQWSTAELDDRSGGRVDVFEAHGIRVHLEDFRVSIPGGQAGLSGKQESGLAIGSPSARHDKAVAVAVKRVDHYTSAELNQHVLEAFDLIFRLGSPGRGLGVIEDHRVRQLLSRQCGGDPRIAQLSPVEELLDGADNVHQVAGLDIGRRVGVDEDSIRGFGVAVASLIRRLQEEAVPDHSSNDVVPGQYVFSLQGRGHAGALDLPDFNAVGYAGYLRAALESDSVKKRAGGEALAAAAVGFRMGQEISFQVR